MSARGQQDRLEPGDQPRAAPWSWQARPAGARTGIVLLAFSLAAGIGVGAYRVFIGSSTNSTPAVSEPGLSTEGEKVEIPTRPDETEKPVDAPSQPPQMVKNVESRGTVVLDALPWAEVVSIMDERGNRQEIPANSFTPWTLTLPVVATQSLLETGQPDREDTHHE